MRFLLILLIGWLAIEIAVFAVVAQKISVLGSIGLTLLIGFIGIAIVRRMGLSAFQQMEVKLRRGETPVKDLGQSFGLLIAAIFLILPGFLSDIIGLLFLLPPVRLLFAAAIIARFGSLFLSVSSFGSPGENTDQGGQPDGVIDLDCDDWSDASEDDKGDDVPPRLRGTRDHASQPDRAS